MFNHQRISNMSKIMHGLVPGYTAKKPVISEPYRCKRCPQIFDSAQAFLLHRKECKRKKRKKKVSFLEELALFHKTDVMRIPVLGKKELDLHLFYQLVMEHGGYDQVIAKEGTWSLIFKRLPNYSKTETSASYRMKQLYLKYLYAFEKSVKNIKKRDIKRDIKRDKKTEIRKSCWAV